MSPLELDLKKILSVLPHRYPFLLVDRIIELVPGKTAAGYKNVTINEPFFQGHFPGEPVMPGVLIVEALAQVGALVVLSEPQNAGKLALFAGIDKFRFKKMVIPGDRLELKVILIRKRGPVGKGEAVAKVDGELVASGELTFALIEKTNKS